MNYNRNRTQLYLESRIGVTAVEQLKNKKYEFENYYLDNLDSINMEILLQEDAQDYFYNGVLSIADGVNSLIKRKYSWATIKLYYGIFYLLRSTLGINKYALLQNNGVYLLKIAAYQKPKKSNKKNYTTTHGATINYYIDNFKLHDYLLTNEINGKTTYSWMIEAREIVNYRNRSFMEPDCLDIWKLIDLKNKENDIKSIFNYVLNNPDIYCFQEDYAILTIPLKSLFITTNVFQQLQLLGNIDPLRLKYIENILDFEEIDVNLYKILFNK